MREFLEVPNKSTGSFYRHMRVNKNTLQIAVTPTLMDTTEDAKKRFTPIDRGCYVQGELPLKYLPSQFYRYSHKKTEYEFV